MEYSISSYEKTASCTICGTKCFLSGVLVITDGTNPATVMLFDKNNTATGDFIISTAGLAVGSTAANVSNIAFQYVINGTVYSKAAVSAGTAPGNDVIPGTKYGAVAFDIGADGNIDAIEAADNATGYDTAALAVVGLPAVAADHVRMGYVTVMKSDGAFTFGATALSAANVTEVYTSTTPETFNKLWGDTVAGASHYGWRNWNYPVRCAEGIHLSISGTGASAIVEYI